MHKMLPPGTCRPAPDRPPTAPSWRLGHRPAGGRREHRESIANFLEYSHPTSAFFVVLFMLLPLGISYDAAAASSDCDLLADTLNEKRKRGDATDPDFEHAIGRVEHILDRENTKQGLGFCVGHRVVDLKTLGNIVAAIVGVATTAVPILFSLRPSTVSLGDDVCSLTASEIAIFQSAMMGRNESCAYNMTLNEILGM